MRLWCLRSASSGHDMRRLPLLILCAVTAAASGDIVIPFSGRVLGVAFSSDGKLLAAACSDGTIKFWDTQSGALSRTMTWSKDPVNFAYSPSSGMIASAGRDMVINLWDMKTGEIKRRMSGHQRRVGPLAFSTDGKLLASGSFDKTLRIWDTDSGASRLTAEEGWGNPRSLAFSPNGEILVSASSDTNLRIWNVRTGKLERTIEDLPLATFALTFPRMDAGSLRADRIASSTSGTRKPGSRSAILRDSRR